LMRNPYSSQIDFNAEVAHCYGFENQPNYASIKIVKGIPLYRRFLLRALQWMLGDEELSQTHPINAILFARCREGKWMQSEFRDPRISVGRHTYGLRAENFPLYHPADKVSIGSFCSIGDGV